MKIQWKFKSKLHLFIDIPKNGFKNNDGNISKRFFPDLSAETTELDRGLMYNML